MKKALFIFTCITTSAFSQQVPKLTQRLGGCEAQIDKGKRGVCFESLATDAIRELNKLTSNQPSNASLNASAATSTAANGAASSSKSNQYTPFVAKAKETITSKFKDPASVQFRNLYVSHKVTPVLCGELNGKNAYGGYVGFRRFVSSIEPSLQEIESPNDSAPGLFEMAWNMACSNEVERIE